MLPRRACFALLLLLVIPREASGRGLKQDSGEGAEDENNPGGTLQQVDANFANTYAGDEQNDVEQTVYLFVPDPEEEKEVPVWVRDVIPQRLDPDNPICTLGDREVYPRRTATTSPVEDTELTTVVFYQRPDSDIRAEVIVEFDGRNSSQGFVEVTGPGTYGRLSVNAGTPRKTLCGDWAWSSFGYYTFELKVSGAAVIIEYYNRDHVSSRSASFEEFPITFNLKVHTTVAGNGVNVLSDTALQSQYVDGKIMVTLNNDIVGDSNTLSQTARARVDGAVGSDTPYEY